jgi:2-dehydrotetronate isomerase
MPRFAANLGFLFTDRPLVERFGAAAAAGFRAVELQFPYDLPAEQAREEIDRHGLTMLGINTRPTPESGLAAVPGRERDFAAQFTQALDYASIIGARAIHVMSGAVPDSDRQDAERTFVANLVRAADLADPWNINLYIEAINLRDRPNYFLNRVEQAAAILAEVDRPNVRLQFDFYHAQIAGGDLLARFEQVLPRVAHVQVAGVPSRAEPDEGEVNFSEVFAAIDRLGYRGWIGCEYMPRGRTEDGLGWGAAYGLGANAANKPA